MTKRAKKRLLPILTVSVIFAVILFLGQTLTRDSFVSLVLEDLTTGKVTELTQEDDGLHLFRTVLHDTVSVTREDGDFGLKIMEGTVQCKDSTEKGYEIYLRSIFQRTVYLRDMKENVYYCPTQESFTKLFSCEPFASALPNTEPLIPLLYTQGEEGTALAATGKAVSGTWNYATADGKQQSKPISGDTGDEYYIFTEAAPFSVYFEGQTTWDREPVMTVSLYKAVGGEKGELIFSCETDGENIPAPDEEGFYIYELEVFWQATPETDYNGTVIYDFNIRLDLPAAPKLSAAALPQGQVTALRVFRVSDSSTLTASCEKLGYTGSFTEIDGIPTSLIGIPMDAEPGVYEITVTENGVASSVYLTVTEGEFPSQNLTISTTVKDSWTEEQENYLSPLRAFVSGKNYISGVFSEPVTGKITTAFGTFRYTNGAETPTRHNGIDIAAKKHPDILAPMDGRVVFTMEMLLTGNTVVIDHGMNVLSYYYHLDSIDVEEGQTVCAGDKIGTMGTTGYSTGDHLHYTVMVNGVAVDPNVFYGTDFSHFE